MKHYPEELAAAELYEAQELAQFPRLTVAQLDSIRQAAKRFNAWTLKHTLLHNLISLCVLAGLFAADFLVICRLSRWLPWSTETRSGALLAGNVCGVVHGLLMYSISIFSVHEGAVHQRIIQGRGPLARALAFVANNVCRLFLAVPEHFVKVHGAHHTHLGTRDDGTFVTFVLPERVVKSLLPMAPFFDFADYRSWLPDGFSRGRLLSVALSGVYLGGYLVIARDQGLLFALTTLVFVGPWIAYSADRIYESLEHSFMPLDPVNGTRDFGPGLWGLLLGGGPWGQPCHLSHHLAPSLPWYLQLRLHFFLKTVLTEEQKRAFLLRPVVGFPILIANNLRSAAKYLRLARTGGVGVGAQVQP